ncbi:hypothetical protein [Azospirillum doebereinerae]|uniref:Uncharacterized protein n=1 Tax=Azospirillum doebereinerae TaxID=92933 RepID=A0A433J8D1_9PROT|nr:hypothetical protein [Azospirillum doebereinerae]MCG5240366.1 hypothetical protein [Azospirillum doebereinerae]RUQ70236.1 hypothetical protein EJ913_14670 [Azospirillum doebereinerae]
MTAIVPPLKPIRVHGLADARVAAAAAAALGVSVTLLADGACGAAWLLALAGRAMREHPSVAVTALLDCGDRAGEAQGALAAGVPLVMFTGPPGPAARLAAIAEAHGAALLTEVPPTLDQRKSRDPVTACRDWLSAPYH